MTDHEEERSIAQWIGVLVEDAPIDSAPQALWERYYHRLVDLARTWRRGAAPAGVAAAEDPALSAFDSFCRGAAAGRYPTLSGRANLWRLLVIITARKVADQIEYESAQKRDRRQWWNEIEIHRHGSEPASGDRRYLAKSVGREPAPEFAAVMAEQCQILFDLLGDPFLRQVALLKMEGHDNEDIARRMNCS